MQLAVKYTSTDLAHWPPDRKGSDFSHCPNNELVSSLGDKSNIKYPNEDLVS